MMPLAIAVAASALIGYVSLSYEILWFRVYSFATGTSPAVFGILLGFFLAGTALGALGGWKAVSAARRFGDGAQLRNLGLLLTATNAVAFCVIPILAAVVTVGHWGLSLPAVVIAAAGWGASLPVLSQFAIRPDASAGSGVSLLYMGNIVGSVGGTLLTGFFLLDHLGIRDASVALAVAGQLVALVLIVWGGEGKRAWRHLLPAAAVLLSLVPVASGPPFDALYERLQWRRSFQSGMRFAHIVENRSGVITITPAAEIYGGGAYDGVISTDLVNDRNGIFRAYALAGFHPAPRRVLMIGLSGGAWAQVVANMPGVERLTIVEINPGYVEIVRRYPEVASLLDNPRVELVIDDGRRWLARNPQRRFDAIISNTTFHWRANATNLLSVEYLRLCRSHLMPGGILHYNTTASDDALATALREFPYGYRFRAFATVSDSPFQWDSTRFVSTMRHFTIDGRPVIDPSDPVHLQRLHRLASLEYAAGASGQAMIEDRDAALARLASATSVTDDNMITEWRNALVFRIGELLR